MKFTWITPVLSLGVVFACAGLAQAQPVFLPLTAPPLLQLSADPFKNGGGAEHATQLEADTETFGSTIVGAFQTGRYPDGGSSDIGWATSTDGGKTWASGFLPGITTTTNPHNPFPRISDPAVAYDAAHGVWLIASLPVASAGPAVIVSPSDDGLHWKKPIYVAPAPSGSDKNWIACDNTPSSTFFGQCYVEWDDGNLQVHLNTSSDGGKTWGPTTSGGSGAFGLGGQPVVQPNGTVVVPFSDGGANMLDIVSTNGGKSWSNAVVISPEADHGVSQMRAPALPSARMDKAGNIYVVWHDCSFRSGCSSNDIVMSMSKDGVHWTQKARIPIDPTTSTVDHFTPGIGVDPATSGAAAHIGVIYNFFPKANCSAATCRLFTGFISSHNGGATWSAPTTLTAPMRVTWMANAFGAFVGDYVAMAFTPDGLAHSVFAVARPPSGGTLDEAAFTTPSGLAIALGGPQFSSRFERPNPFARSDHARRHYPPKKKLAKRVMEKE